MSDMLNRLTRVLVDAGELATIIDEAEVVDVRHDGALLLKINQATFLLGFAKSIRNTAPKLREEIANVVFPSEQVIEVLTTGIRQACKDLNVQSILPPTEPTSPAGHVALLHNYVNGVNKCVAEMLDKNKAQRQRAEEAEADAKACRAENDKLRKSYEDLDEEYTGFVREVAQAIEAMPIKVVSLTSDGPPVADEVVETLRDLADVMRMEINTLRKGQETASQRSDGHADTVKILADAIHRAWRTLRAAVEDRAPLTDDRPPVLNVTSFGQVLDELVADAAKKIGELRKQVMRNNSAWERANKRYLEAEASADRLRSYITSQGVQILEPTTPDEKGVRGFVGLPTGKATHVLKSLEVHTDTLEAVTWDEQVREPWGLFVGALEKVERAEQATLRSTSPSYVALFRMLVAALGASGIVPHDLVEEVDEPKPTTTTIPLDEYAPVLLEVPDSTALIAARVRRIFRDAETIQLQVPDGGMLTLTLDEFNARLVRNDVLVRSTTGTVYPAFIEKIDPEAGSVMLRLHGCGYRYTIAHLAAHLVRPATSEGSIRVNVSGDRDKLAEYFEQEHEHELYVASDFLRDVHLERLKQREKWGDVHDADEHPHGELAAAAAMLIHPNPRGLDHEPLWIRALRAKHAGNPRRRLVIAAALLEAENDRLNRTRQAPPDAPVDPESEVELDRMLDELLQDGEE